MASYSLSLFVIGLVFIQVTVGRVARVVRFSFSKNHRGLNRFFLRWQGGGLKLRFPA